MNDLFSPSGLQALRAFIAQPLLCLFDFDGTLVPLVDDPQAVLLPPQVQRQLQALQQRAPVGIVTGRALADLRPRLAFTPDYLIGNHGLEGLPVTAEAAAATATVRDVVSPPAQLHEQLHQQVERWKAQLEPRLAMLDPGILIEDKHYSLSLHYLHAADRLRAERDLLAQLQALQPAPRIIHGKYLFNALPADAGDKGRAVQALLASAGIAQALYVGDDQTDEDVFRLPQPGLFTVHVGDHGGDGDSGSNNGSNNSSNNSSSPAFASAAQWRLAGQPQVVQLLDWLLHEMPAGRR